MAHRIHLKGCRAQPGQSCSCEIKRYSYILLIALVIALIQFTGSVISGSLALLADTMHVLLDGAGAGISVLVARRARVHDDTVAMRIFWMRVSNVLLLGALAWIAVEAVDRFWHPRVVGGTVVMIVAAAGMTLNYWQHTLVPHDHSVTANSQRLHVLGDLGSSAVVLVGGLAIYLTGITWIDPVLSFGIVLLIGYPALKMLFTRQVDTDCGNSQ